MITKKLKITSYFLFTENLDLFSNIFKNEFEATEFNTTNDFFKYFTYFPNS